jgi:predicted DNA binding CopG/RHH family protein
MRKVKLTKREKDIENALLKGEYLDINKDEFRHVAEAIASRKKDSVLNIRINGDDLKLIKKKADRFGIRYQTFISELLHRIAHS